MGCAMPISFILTPSGKQNWVHAITGFARAKGLKASRMGV